MNFMPTSLDTWHLSCNKLCKLWGYKPVWARLDAVRPALLAILVPPKNLGPKVLAMTHRNILLLHWNQHSCPNNNNFTQKGPGDRGQRGTGCWLWLSSQTRLMTGTFPGQLPSQRHERSLWSIHLRAWRTVPYDFMKTGLVTSLVLAARVFLLGRGGTSERKPHRLNYPPVGLDSTLFANHHTEFVPNCAQKQVSSSVVLSEVCRHGRTYGLSLGQKSGKPCPPLETWCQKAQL